MHLFLQFLTMIENVIDFLHHISESCTYFKECHISRGIAHSILQNYSQLFPKNLKVIFGGQNWFIPYIVLYS